MTGRRRLRRGLRPGLTLGIACLILAVLPGQSCGPFFTEAVFVVHQPESREELMRGRLGILWPDLGIIDLALAWRVLQGPPFSPGEIQAETPKPNLAEDQGASGGPLAEWAQARKKITGQDVGPIPTEATVPGQRWQSYGNCLEDAFATAARTLQDRQREYPAAKEAVAEWVRGQDAVFSNCGAPGQLPADIESTAPSWLRQDRAYQTAAAHFYRAEWKPAQSAFDAIAADTASPWHQVASYLVARTLVRQGTLGKPDGVDVPVLLTAQAQLQAIVRKGGPYAGAAQEMLNLVDLRVAPGATAVRLGTAIAQPDAHLHQDLIDLRYALISPSPQPELADARRSDLVDWILTVRDTKDGEAASGHALERWRATRSTAWLSAALVLAQTPSPELTAAAVATPRSSPAWATVTYYRLRLTPGPAAEAEISTLLPGIANVSTRNAFQQLALGQATSLDGFVRLAAMQPAGFDLGMGDPLVSAVPVTPGQKTSTIAGLPIDLPGAKRFDLGAATTLNQQLPLTTLAAIVEQHALPKQLQFELAMAVWTRAVLLNRPEVARSLTSAMIEGEPGWTPWLRAYDQAATEDDRRLAALLALMRFPSVRPYVNAGAAREDGFAGYSFYRDNWWCAAMGQYPAGGDSYSGAYNFQGDAPTSPPGAAPVAAVKPPPFITAAMTAQAAEESAALGKIGDAPEYFGSQALAWVKAHPSDPRGAELLGFAIRAMRNGCNLEHSAALHRQVFDALHAHYKQSEWARRYSTVPADAP